MRMFVLSRPARRDGPRPDPDDRLRRVRDLPRARPTPRRRWPGSRPAARTSWCRCAVAARRARTGTSPATAATSRTCSTTSHAAAEALIAAGDDHARAAGDPRRLQRRPARRRRAHPAPRPVRRRRLLARRCWTWCATRSSRSGAPGTTSTAPPTTRRSSGWLLSYSPYHHVAGRDRLPGGAVHRVRVRHPRRPAATRARCARPCSTPPRATPAPARCCCVARPTSGHGARSVGRTVDLAVDQLAFLAAHTGLELP